MCGMCSGCPRSNLSLFKSDTSLRRPYVTEGASRYRSHRSTLAGQSILIPRAFAAALRSCDEASESPALVREVPLRKREVGSAAGMEGSGDSRGSWEFVPSTPHSQRRSLSKARSALSAELGRWSSQQGEADFDPRSFQLIRCDTHSLSCRFFTSLGRPFASSLPSPKNWLISRSKPPIRRCPL